MTQRRAPPKPKSDWLPGLILNVSLGALNVIAAWHTFNSDQAATLSRVDDRTKILWADFEDRLRERRGGERLSE